MSNLKTKASNGMKWNAIERFAILIISFIINIILARLLSPSDYGLLAMLAVFIAISEVFVNSGFGVALIQNKERTEVDFSTAFYYNIFMSIIFYALLFFIAPYISEFYEASSLTLITRIISLNLIIAAFGSLQNIKLVVKVDFKTQAKIALISNITAGIVCVILALLGFGVWVLVVQSVLSTLLKTLLRIYFVKWMPLFVFSKVSLNKLFGYGSKILAITLIDVLYNNLYNIIIGKKYSSASLGYFSRSNVLLNLPITNITSIIEKVTFPILSEIQNDIPRLAVNYRKILKMSAFISFPVLSLMCVLAKSIVIILLTEKWIEAVPFIQVLSFSFIFYPLNVINVNLLKVIGKTNLLVKLEIFKKIVTTIIILITIPYGVIGLCYGIVVSTFLSYIINSIFIGKIIEFGLMEQLNDLFPLILLSTSMGVVLFFTSQLIESYLVELLIGSILGSIFYLGTSYIFKLSEFKELMNMLNIKRVV